MLSSGLSPELVWGLIPRFVGLLYLIAFGSVALQARDLLGVHGASPLAVRLAAIRRDFPGIRRLFDFPTVFWLNASDAAIQVVPWLGVLCGVAACYGGAPGYAGLALGWILWLSLEPAVLIFPWDTMLLEAGFLVLFLPLTRPLPELTTSALPLPSVAFMVQWLVLRLMLGFARVKFVGTEKGDGLYLRGFLIWAPLPTPLGWWGHHAPRALLRAALVFMFVGEAVAPLLGFIPGTPRLISFALMSALMIGIQSTGNWGYFNIGFVLLSVCLLDVHTSLADLWREPWASRAFDLPDAAVHAAMLLLFITSLVYVAIVNSWVTRTWLQWPWDVHTWNRRWAHWYIAYLRALAPFRIVNGYGVFPPNAAPPMRLAPVIEGSADGVTWKAYEYRYLPTRASSPLKVFAPHHPRFDQALHYYGMSIHDASPISALIGDGNPYQSYLRSCFLERRAHQLFRADAATKALFANDPFPDAPPEFIRVSGHALVPTRPGTFLKTGERWKVRRLGTMIRPTRHKPWIDAQAVSCPELFHPDFLEYKRRSRPLRELLAAYRRGVAPDQAVLVESDLGAAEVESFWQKFVPQLAEARGDWSRIHERAEAVEAQFGQEQMYRYERLLQRFAWLLRAETEPYFARDAAPKIELLSNFRFELLLHEIICDGREAYLELLRAPERAAERARRTTDASQLWVLTIMRYDMMLYQICAFRWTELGSHGHRYNLHGICEFYPLLSAHPAPGEEFHPVPTKHEDGEFTVQGLYAPPRADLVADA